MISKLRAVTISVLSLGLIGNSQGCPICDSNTAVDVRALLAADIVGPLIGIILPFIVLLSALRFYNTGWKGFLSKNSQ